MDIVDQISGIPHFNSMGQPDSSLHLSTHRQKLPVVSDFEEFSFTQYVSQPHPFAIKFETRIDGRLRTCGILIARQRQSADDLDGLDLAHLTALANVPREAAARGKLVLVGRNGVRVLQTQAGRRPEAVFCGNATAAILAAPIPSSVRLIGPADRHIDVLLEGDLDAVRQYWRLAVPVIQVLCYRGRRAVVIDGLNRYAIVEGPLPAGVTPEMARHSLVGQDLAAKLVVIEGSTSLPIASFHNAAGRHGAAPMTGLAALGIAARGCDWLGAMLANGEIGFVEGNRAIRARLPNIEQDGGRAIRLRLPEVAIRATPLTLTVGAGS